MSRANCIICRLVRKPNAQLHAPAAAPGLPGSGLVRRLRNDALVLAPHAPRPAPHGQAAAVAAARRPGGRIARLRPLPDESRLPRQGQEEAEEAARPRHWPSWRRHRQEEKQRRYVQICIILPFCSQKIASLNTCFAWVYDKKHNFDCQKIPLKFIFHVAIFSVLFIWELLIIA